MRISRRSGFWGPPASGKHAESRDDDKEDARVSNPAPRVPDHGGPDRHEHVAGGPAGKLVGKVKEKIGALTGNHHLAREGRLQHAAAETDEERERREEVASEREEEAALRTEAESLEIERERLSDRVEAEQRQEEEARELARGRAEVEAAAEREREAAASRQQAAEVVAEAEEMQAGREHAARVREAQSAEASAEVAERVAESLDPPKTDVPPTSHVEEG